MAGKGGVGVWEPPPTRAMMMYSAGFSAAAAIALLIGRCDIGGILAAIAFVFGLIGSIEFLVWRSFLVPRTGQGGTGVWEPPPTARSGDTDDPGRGGTGVWEPPPMAPLVLGTGGTGFLLATLIAVLLDRCPLGTALAFIALILLLLSLLQVHSLGRRS
jgi:hypothetical protein